MDAGNRRSAASLNNKFNPTTLLFYRGVTLMAR